MIHYFSGLQYRQNGVGCGAWSTCALQKVTARCAPQRLRAAKRSNTATWGPATQMY